MRKKLQRSITVLMAFLVLLSSTGLGFIEHQCLVRGKSMSFVSKENPESSCCAKKKALRASKTTSISKTDCCKESQKFEKVETVTSQGSYLVKFAKSLPAGIPPSFLTPTFTVAQWGFTTPSFQQDVLSFTSRFHGRSMCVFVQSFLI